MTRTNYNEVWNLTEGDIWRCLGIPFKGRKMWFHIILPKKRFGLATVMEQFNANLLRKRIGKKPSGEIKIGLPIFHMVNKFSLIKSLPKLGMNNVFEGMINNKYVKLDNIFHGAGININQYNLPERDNSNFVYEDQKDEGLPGFCAASPFIYFVTLVENDVNELQNLLLLGVFYGSH
uniref:Serpin domain-containing protein n=1 Tax=Panagrolaimus davidi TaxID=227884 RepID=A0A914PUT2_9BILA